MRLVIYREDGGDAIGIRRGERVFNLNALHAGAPIELSALMAAGPAFLKELAERAEKADDALARPFSDLTLRPVAPRGGKILCLGLNYVDHAREANLPIPQHPVVFLRCSTSLLAAGAPIVAPAQSEQLDYEGELAIVIGTGGRGISVERALSHVAGYTVFNDVTVRDYQFRGPQWTLGKNFDGTGVLGPELVTADELPPGAKGLLIRTRINGNIVQDGTTGDMIFSVAQTIASLSETMTLEPGDVIATGTPAGVGAARKPALWLKPGDLCEVEIEGVGRLSNRIVSAGPGSGAV